MELVLPCKVGDLVYAIRRNGSKKTILKRKVTEMYFADKSMRLCIVVKGVTRGEWGKAVFPSYESAENYIRGLNND